MAERILIVLWSAALAFICIDLLGTTHFLSSILGNENLAVAIDILFVVLAIIFAVVLSMIVPRHLPRWVKIIAFLPLIIFAVLMIGIASH